MRERQAPILKVLFLGSVFASCSLLAMETGKGSGSGMPSKPKPTPRELNEYELTIMEKNYPGSAEYYEMLMDTLEKFKSQPVTTTAAAPEFLARAIAGKAEGKGQALAGVHEIFHNPAGAGWQLRDAAKLSSEELAAAVS